VVQIFTALQFLELAHEYQGTDWAILATHDPVSHEERPLSSPRWTTPPARWMKERCSNAIRRTPRQLRLERVPCGRPRRLLWDGCGQPTGFAADGLVSLGPRS
jgi:hypothetical protein